MDKRKKFIKDLKLLLVKYDCYISADDHYEGYAECGEDVRMTVEFNDYTEDIDLGSIFSGNSEINME